MPFIAHDSLICPIDNLPLIYQNGSLSCSHDHQYDIGKPGYANLLNVQDKRSKSPGDSKDMVNARAAFLSSGFYEPIARHLAELIASNKSDELTLVDAGCGEGYYLEKISSLVDRPLNLIGFDISKWAVQRAARRCEGTWLVASNKRIPLADRSTDVVLDMFGFPNFRSFERILKHSGMLLCVSPAERHLIEIRELIYPSIKKTKSRLYPPEFRLISQKLLSYGLTLAKDDIANLLAMTPHFYRAPKDGLSKLEAQKELEITIDVEIDILMRSENPTLMVPL